MKKKSIVILVSVCLIPIAFLGFIVYLVVTDPMADMYRDRIEYPLAKVNVTDNSDYLLVKWHHNSPVTIEVITNTAAIKENASVFSVDNDGSIYGTTPDGLIYLYRDGELIDTVPFDDYFTRKIEYGTLQFRQVNELQYLLLDGYEIVEQGENFSILGNARNDEPYYYCFAHGEDLGSTETVYRLDSGDSLNKMPMPHKASSDLLEFIAPFPTYAGDETRHWFFRLSDLKLSESYLNVKTIQENFIVCTDSNYQGPRIIIRDVFDKAVYYREITGNFSEELDRLFLLSAEFSEGSLCAEYVGSDGQVHNEIFSLD